MITRENPNGRQRGNVASEPDERSQIVGNTEYRYSSNWIKKLETELHWRLYWKQQKLLEPFLGDSDKIQELGVGSGFTANYLQSKGHEVVTFDIDPEKKPDVVGNLVTQEFSDTYDHILSFEVFEHIPYEDFLQVLRKLRPVCRKSLCLSVPFGKRELFELKFRFPKVGTRKFSIKVGKKRIIERHHFWELDFGEFTRTRFLRDIEDSGYEIANAEEYQLRYFVSCVPKDI